MAELSKLIETLMNNTYECQGKDDKVMSEEVGE